MVTHPGLGASLYGAAAVQLYGLPPALALRWLSYLQT